MTENTHISAVATFLLGTATADGLRRAARAVDAIDLITAGLGAKAASAARLGAIVAALTTGRPEQARAEADDIDGASPSPPTQAAVSAEVQELKAAIRDAQASASRRPAKQRKGRPPKPWADSGGNLLPDWTDEAGVGYLNQRRAGEALFMSRRRLLDLEARGHLTPVFHSIGKRRFVGYSIAELDALTEKIREVNQRMAAEDTVDASSTASTASADAPTVPHTA